MDSADERGSGVELTVAASGDHWRDYAKRWGRIRPPLRPTRGVVDAIRDSVAQRDRRVLLLGVTPELSQAFPNLLAVDKNAEMIARWWPGDTPTRRALCANWLTLPLSTGPFSAVVSDGALSNVAYPDDTAILLRQARDLLEPGGRFVSRLFERPDDPWSYEALVAEASRPATVNFHAFKWKLAMRLAEEEGASLPVQRILDVFNRLLPDRQRLASATGWAPEDINTIDVYEGSDIIYAFPNRAELLDLIPSGFGAARVVPCGGYDLAECCPILVLEREPA